MPRDASNYSEIEANPAQELYNTTDFCKSSSKKAQLNVCKDFVPETYSSLDLPPDEVYNTFDNSKCISKRSKLNGGTVGHSLISNYSQIVPEVESYETTSHKKKPKKRKINPNPSGFSHRQHDSTASHNTYAQLHLSSAKSDSTFNNRK